MMRGAIDAQYRDRMAMSKADLERVRDDFVEQVPFLLIW